MPQKAQQISEKFGPRAAEGYMTEYDRLIAAGKDIDALTPAVNQATQEAPPTSPPVGAVAPQIRQLSPLFMQSPL